LTRFLHSIFCQMGSIVMITAICYMIYLYCVEHKAAKTKRIISAVVVLLTATLIGFVVFWTAVVFQMPAMFVFITVTFFVNFAMLRKIYDAGSEADRSLIIDRQTSRKTRIMWWIATCVVLASITVLVCLAISHWYVKPY